MNKCNNTEGNQPKPRVELTSHSRITVDEASTLFNLPKWKLWNAIRKGLLPCQKLLNGRIYLKVSDIEAALAASSDKESSHA